LGAAVLAGTRLIDSLEI